MTAMSLLKTCGVFPPSDLELLVNMCQPVASAVPLNTPVKCWTPEILLIVTNYYCSQ